MGRERRVVEVKRLDPGSWAVLSIPFAPVVGAIWCLAGVMGVVGLAATRTWAGEFTEVQRVLPAETGKEEVKLRFINASVAISEGHREGKLYKELLLLEPGRKVRKAIDLLPPEGNEPVFAKDGSRFCISQWVEGEARRAVVYNAKGEELKRLELDRRMRVTAVFRDHIVLIKQSDNALWLTEVFTFVNPFTGESRTVDETTEKAGFDRVMQTENALVARVRKGKEYEVRLYRPDGTLVWSREEITDPWFLPAPDLSHSLLLTGDKMIGRTGELMGGKGEVLNRRLELQGVSGVCFGERFFVVFCREQVVGFDYRGIRVWTKERPRAGFAGATTLADGARVFVAWTEGKSWKEGETLKTEVYNLADGVASAGPSLDLSQLKEWSGISVRQPQPDTIEVVVTDLGVFACSVDGGR